MVRHRGLCVVELPGSSVCTGACVARFSASGTLLHKIDLPCRKVTSCAFGGADLRDLYITTSSKDDTDLTVEPLAGSTFVARSLPWRGVPAFAYVD